MEICTPVNTPKTLTPLPSSPPLQPTNKRRRLIRPIPILLDLDSPSPTPPRASRISLYSFNLLFKKATRAGEQYLRSRPPEDEEDVHDDFKSLCPDLHVTRGEYDEDSCYLETKTLTIGQFKIGICHSHQVTRISSKHTSTHEGGVVVYVYELIDGEVRVDKIDFKKKASPRSAH